MAIDVRRLSLALALAALPSAAAWAEMLRSPAGAIAANPRADQAQPRVAQAAASPDAPALPGVPATGAPKPGVAPGPRARDERALSLIHI